MNTDRTKGFTLVELIVSLSIFSIVMLVGMGSVLVMLDANERARNLKTVMNNLNYALESMTRDIRFGEQYVCGNMSGDLGPLVDIDLGDIDISGDCAGHGGDLFSLYFNPGEEDIVYAFDADAGAIMKWSSSDSETTRLTNPDVEITHLRFFTRGIGDDDQQPHVVIVVRGSAGVEPGDVTEFSLQTTVSQRQPEQEEIE